MIRLLKLYSHPQKFIPIEFTDGINLILGEKVTEGEMKTRKDRKTNGVGKSMCIEFINFCLLKDADSSRVMKIPFDKFPDETAIKLDLRIGERRVTISRTKKDSNKPLIVVDDEPTTFSGIDDAWHFLGDLFYKQQVNENESQRSERPSFRELLGPLIRDEDSEFKDILGCYDLQKRIPTSDLVKSHLYFFGIGSLLIREIKSLTKKLEEGGKNSTYLRDRLTDDGKKKLGDVKAELNALERELEKAGDALENFKTDPILQQNKADVMRLEADIEDLRIRQASLRVELHRIEGMPRVEVVDVSDVQIVYDKFKDGLGPMVSKTITEVLDFKKKIEAYQDSLFNERMTDIRKELGKLAEDLRELDSKKSLLLKDLDQGGLLQDLKAGFSIYTQKKEELSSTVSNLREYERLERQIVSDRLKKDSYFSQLDAEIFAIQSQIRSFNQTLVDLHDYIMGNATVSFDITPVNSSKNKQIVRFDLRIDDDGSHSVNRTKVFIYDIALMLNAHTMKSHPMLLIHDNIFDVDQDTLVQCLNFLGEQESTNDFQYILTLNRDKIENEERRKEVKLDIDSHVRARFTRQKNFLGVDYQEIEV